GTGPRSRSAGCRVSPRASAPGYLCPRRAVRVERLSLQEPFVVTLHQLALDLFDGIQADANHDQNSSTAEGQVLHGAGVADLQEQVRQHGDDTQVDGARQGDPI